MRQPTWFADGNVRPTQYDVEDDRAASPQSAGGQLMVGFGSWLRTPALTKSFPSLAPERFRGFLFGQQSRPLVRAWGILKASS